MPGAGSIPDRLHLKAGLSRADLTLTLVFDDYPSLLVQVAEQAGAAR